jgi:hypothetical protein
MENLPPELIELVRHIRQRFPDLVMPEDEPRLDIPFTLEDSAGKPVAQIIPPQPGHNPYWRWKDVSKL